MIAFSNSDVVLGALSAARCSRFSLYWTMPSRVCMSVSVDSGPAPLPFLDCTFLQNSRRLDSMSCVLLDVVPSGIFTAEMFFCSLCSSFGKEKRRTFLGFPEVSVYCDIFVSLFRRCGGFPPVSSGRYCPLDVLRNGICDGVVVSKTPNISRPCAFLVLSAKF